MEATRFVAGLGYMTSIAIIGGGNIGEALISGLVASEMNPKNIRVAHRRAERGQELKETYGVVPYTDNLEAVDEADVVFLCVKPHQVLSVVDELADTLDNNDATVLVSMAAGVSLAALEEVLPAGSAVVRVMPNTPMLVRKGMSAIAPGRFAGDEAVKQVTKLLQAVGEVEVIEEKDMDAVIAMSGSSPAYLFLLAEAMIDAGTNLGLSRDVARKLATQAFHGAAAMLVETGEEPAQLRAKVSSPGGTTIRAIRALEDSGARSAIYRAAEAAAARNAELQRAANASR